MEIKKKENVERNGEMEKIITWSVRNLAAW